MKESYYPTGIFKLDGIDVINLRINTTENAQEKYINKSLD